MTFRSPPYEVYVHVRGATGDLRCEVAVWRWSYGIPDGYDSLGLVGAVRLFGRYLNGRRWL